MVLTEQEEHAYDLWIESCERRFRMETRTGYKFCSCCGQYSVRSWTTPTRQYGGGWNTYTRCLFCGHEEVCT